MTALRSHWSQDQLLPGFLLVSGLGISVYFLGVRSEAGGVALLLAMFIWIALFLLLLIRTSFKIRVPVVVAMIPLGIVVLGAVYKIATLSPPPTPAPSRQTANVAAPDTAMPAPAGRGAASTGGAVAHLEYKSIGTVDAVMPADSAAATRDEGASFLGYAVIPRAAHATLHVHLTANAYADQGNEVVIAVFRTGQAAPVALFSKPVKAGGRVFFDERFDLQATSGKSVSLDVRMGTTAPGEVVINGPASGAPHAGVPFPALTITETAAGTVPGG